MFFGTVRGQHSQMPDKESKDLTVDEREPPHHLPKIPFLFGFVLHPIKGLFEVSGQSIGVEGLGEVFEVFDDHHGHVLVDFLHFAKIHIFPIIKQGLVLKILCVGSRDPVESFLLQRPLVQKPDTITKRERDEPMFWVGALCGERDGHAKQLGVLFFLFFGWEFLPGLALPLSQRSVLRF